MMKVYLKSYLNHWNETWDEYNNDDDRPTFFLHYKFIIMR